MKEISQGASMIDTQHEPTHDLRDAFFKRLDDSHSPVHKQRVTLKTTWIDTPLGPMIAVADKKSLFLLEFVTRRGLEREVKRLWQRGFALVQGCNSPLASVEAELEAYFSGELTIFKTPYQVCGSLFQQQVWEALCQVPYGETRSYAQQAAMVGKPTAYRAVANANGANQLAIIVPCHRIIASDGSLGGYGGGLALKQWLINHEKRYTSQI